MSPDPSQTPGPHCTVVVCTRNRPTELERCLDALAHLTYPSFDVLVVDNAPADSRARELAERHGAAYVVEPRPGLSRARNRGARETKAEIVAYLDDDAVAEADWLSALAREFADPQVMAVTGRTMRLGTQSEACARFSGIGEPDFGGAERLTVDRQTPYWFERANFGGVGIGMNMAFRRQAFSQWPGFDERLGRGSRLPGCEEHYAFFALLDRGYRVVYTPEAVVRHPAPPTLQELRARYLRTLAASAAYLLLLVVEQPRYRRAALRYAWETLTGSPRAWRATAAQKTPRIAPRWRVVLACLFGFILYARSRL